MPDDPAPPPSLLARHDEEMVTPDEVAKLFKVDPKTVTRWANNGTLGPVRRTPGGHRRFYARYVEAVWLGEEPPEIPAAS